MKTVLRSLLAIGLIISASSFSKAKTLTNFNYQVHIPAENTATLLGCNQAAQDLAQRFTAGTNIANAKGSCLSVVSATFDGQPTKIYSLQVDYIAESSAPLYSARVGGLVDLFSNSIDGAYISYADCLADISNQTQAFTKSTSLIAVGAFCSPSDSNDYFLQIDGFGKPQKTLGLVHQADGSQNTAIRLSISNLISKQATIIRTSGDAYYYYSAKPLNLEQVSFGLFRDEKQCTDQIESAKKILLAANSTAEIVNCVIDEKISGAFVLSGIGDTNKMVQPIWLQNTYFSFSECMSDRSAVILRQQEKVSGAICTPDAMNPSKYSMNLFN